LRDAQVKAKRKILRHLFDKTKDPIAKRQLIKADPEAPKELGRKISLED
jgi:hypothetical protein